MARFEDIDLARLGAVPDLVSTDFETELSALIAGFSARWEALRVSRPDLNLPVIDATSLDSDAIGILLQEVAYRLVTVKKSYNDGVRAVMLASTWGAFLEHRAAEFGLTRQILIPANPATGAAAVYEGDASLRRRRQMAIEAISNSGPYGAYIWFAENAHPQVKNVAVYGPESGIAGVDPGEVLIVVVDRRGDGTADSQVVEAIRLALSPKRVRPLTEALVTVQSAAIVPFTVDVTLTVLPGADNSLIQSRALSRIQTYLDDRHKAGVKIARSGIESAATLLDESGLPLVEGVTVNSPASDVVPTLLQAGYASSVVVSVEVETDG